MIQKEIPIQPVDSAVICKPYDEPNDHWFYDKKTGVATRAGNRREAGYWYKTDRVGTGQTALFLEEDHDLLTLVNLLRKDVKRWRDADYRGASNVTKELLRHWARTDRERRLFFCQREAVETIIYLAELRIPGKSSRTGFQNFNLSDDDLKRLLRAERPSFHGAGEYYPTLADVPADSSLMPLRRLGCKMATGSGKTVVMAMLIAWAFCNRAQNPQTREFPNGVFVCCPNLTVKERLQVLRPENPNNYYAEFDIVPEKYRTLMHTGKVLVENWHRLAEESEHKEGDATYAVVNKGPETPETLARRVLGDLYERMPIMVLNDEGHHAWRPPATIYAEGLSPEEKKALEDEAREATVWIDGLDQINNALSGDRGISFCVDLSATPFYIGGSGHPEGRPFPWLVSDFGLVDAIESGIVKIPRLPVSDTTGRPDPKYFKLWEWIKDGLQPAELMTGKSKKPRPDVVYREAQGALIQIADQWFERFKYNEEAAPGQQRVPPVLIIVCDNTDVAEIFYQNISGEREEEVATEADVVAVLTNNGETSKKRRGSKQKKTQTIYEGSKIRSEFSNTPTAKPTIRIDSKLLAEAESDDPNKKKTDIAEELRRVVATVGKPGEPGEHVRCVVSVSMLTEGWDANNVTHILGIRAFGSQLLCEQVVGRGLRRMNYKPDESGLLPEEYVDVYGIPFSMIPFKGRPAKKPEPDDKPLNSVRALDERAAMEIKFPIVEGYTFSLKKNLIRCDVDKMEGFPIEPNREPTATYLVPQVGIKTGSQSRFGTEFPGVEQDRETYYEQNHLQTIEFEIARLVLEQLISDNGGTSDQKRRVLRLQSRHQLFPQIYQFVQEFVSRKVDFQGTHTSELGLLKYVQRIVERLRDGIFPDESEGEPPLLPVLYRYEPVSSTAKVQFVTKRTCFATHRSHINMVVADTATWESAAAFRLEQSRAVKFYARNDHLDFRIPYEFQGIDHNYEPDFLVRLQNDVTLILEIKGYEDAQAKAKHDAAKRWVSAVNNWGQLGIWDFHVCKNPQLLSKELEYLVENAV
jgi:type III restriction enzyme